MNLVADIESFIASICDESAEIYNEFSLQHELGIHLRNQHPDKKVQFERNINSFGFSMSNFVKREIDISIFSPGSDKLLSAIELKFPRNGQVPEQMFSFCKDIAFLEELVEAGFESAYFLAVVDDPLFYSGSAENIYSYFRGNSCLTGVIQKPTGKKDSSVNVRGKYSIVWKPIKAKIRYCLLDIGTYKVNAM